MAHNNDVEEFIPFNSPETPEKMKEVARKELGETEEIKEKGLQDIKALIREHKVTCITRDDFLLRFLRTKKFNVLRAFETLRSYSLQRAALHKRLMKFRPEVLEVCLRNKILGFLPYRDPEERLLFFFTIGNWNTSICSDEDVAMAIIVLTNYAAETESSQITGLHAVFEDTRLPLTAIPHVLRQAILVRNFIFDGLPMRYKGFHSINENFLIKYFLFILDPFLSKKIRNRIVLHGKTRESFFQLFPSCIVPDEYGGTLGPLNIDHIMDVMLDYLQKMKDEQRYFLHKNY